MSFFIPSFLIPNTAPNLNDGHSVIVAAHGDDETLWFEPLIKNAKAIVYLGGALGQTRYNYVLNVFGSNGVYNKAIPIYYAFNPGTDQNWIDEAISDKCYRDHVTYSYENMYNNVRPILQQLRLQGMRRVITHNPWGEYGHYAHRVISNVIRNMGADDLGFDVWFNDVVKVDDPVDIYKYYKSWFLTKVPYSKKYIFDFNVVNTVRSGMITTLVSGINPDNGNPISADLWTWDHSSNGYPTGERKYWGAVINQQDLIKKYPLLDSQIQKIKGEIPYTVGDLYEEYVVESRDTCNWPDYLDDGFTVIVAAHADDEVLWFEPMLKRTMAIVYLGGPLGTTRNNFVKNVYETNPMYANSIKIVPGFNVVTDQEWINLAINPCYRDNTVYPYSVMYSALKTKLLELQSQGMKRVLTHNPWGEYGHPHHRRISDIVRDIAINESELTFDVWYNDVAIVNNTDPNTIAERDKTYYSTLFLNGVTYTNSYIFNYNKLNYVRSGMINTIVYGTNPNTGQPWSDDLWTWPHKKYDYPTGERKYWCAVDNGVDLVAANSTLATQISKIKGEIPYQTGEQYSEYLVLPSYSC